MHRNEVDAIEKVLAEGMLAHHLLQVGICGTNYPHIHFPRTALTQRLESLFLQHPEELHLARQIQFTNLIEEDGSLVRQFETSLTIGHRIGKCSLLVTEHLALEQSLRNAAQIDLHERLVPAGAVQVDGFGYQFLSRTALARDQYRRSGTCHPFHRGQYVQQRLALADDAAPVEPVIVSHRRIGRLVLGRELQGGLDALHQGRVVPGLRNEIEGSGLHPLHRQRNTPPRRHENDRHIRTKELDLPEEHQPLFAVRGKAEVHIHQNQLRRNGTDRLDGFLRTGNRLNIVLRPLEHEAERRTDCTIIINYQYHNPAKVNIIPRIRRFIV